MGWNHQPVYNEIVSLFLLNTGEVCSFDNICIWFLASSGAEKVGSESGILRWERILLRGFELKPPSGKEDWHLRDDWSFVFEGMML